MTEAVCWDAGDLLLTLHVQPRANSDALVGPHGDALKVRIMSAPVDGKANAHLVRFLAGEFGVARNAVELIAGASSRRKRFRIRQPQKLPGIIRSMRNAEREL